MNDGTQQVGHWLKPIHLWFVAIVLACAAIASAFMLPVGANADYICTRTITTTGDCTNGSWSAWRTVSEVTTNGVTTTTLERTYTGTRATSATLSYLNLRTACQAGYTQQSYGSLDGESGNQGRGGDITTQYSACQEIQTQTNTSNGTSKINTTTVDTGGATTTTTHVSTVGDLDTTAGTIGGTGTVGGGGLTDAAGSLVVKPTLVHPGDTVAVTWTATGVLDCTVTGTNGDTWTGLLNSTKTSGAIRAQTTYSLRCPTSDGAAITASTMVNIIPSFQEQ